MAPLNTLRPGAACGKTRADDNCNHVRRFLVWVGVEQGFRPSSIVHVFGSPKVSAAAQKYVSHLVNDRGCKWSYCTKVVLALLALTRFVLSMRRAGAAVAAAQQQQPAASASIDQLVALHRQCVREASTQSKFLSAETRTKYLDWPGENINLVNYSQHAGVVEELHARLLEYIQIK